jgi:malate permease and related proteins
VSADTTTIVTQMAMLFVLIGVGYACKRAHYTNEEVDTGLSKVVINVAMPALILSSVLSSEESLTLEEIGITFLFCMLVMLFVAALAFVFVAVFRIPSGLKGVYRFMMTFGNVGFLGFPVIQAIYGSGALIYASIFQVPFNLLCYTVGPAFIVQDKQGVRAKKVSIKTFLTPMSISCVAAILLEVFGVHNVPVVTDTLTLLGNMATPAAMIIIGSQMANMPLRDIAGTPRLWVMSAFRLIVNPLFVWLLFSQFVSDPLLLGTLVVFSAMPVANVGVMFSLLYGIDTKTLSQGIIVSTLLSLISIPLLVIFMG